MAVCRLSDPVKSAGKVNLTVMRFQEYMDNDERIKQMQELLVDVKDSTKFARDWRNRSIGHNDFNLKVKMVELLESATLGHVDKAIAALHATLAYVSSEFMESHLDDKVIDGLNNEMVMLHRLFLGDEQVELETAELKVGRDIRRNLPDWLYNS